ncbi:hypothetical protein BDV98DRAFT_564089 [Pterulicium gracile]|uniref:CENP-V/GFA domain-containing protein n=1 Tax=Pterulicium gracile TaxID=1884261 RepID=A0A5C3QS49_9AGAR|nr:hypothetical protein BDV98DRAFT_564089 [Pterula gracilis]
MGQILDKSELVQKQRSNLHITSSEFLFNRAVMSLPPTPQTLSEPLRVHCRCKALSGTVTTTPTFGAGTYCHCTRCQRRFGAPFSSFAIFANSSVKWDNATKNIPGTDTLVPEAFKVTPDWDAVTDAAATSPNGVVDCTRCGGRIAFFLGTTDGICLMSGAFERDGEAGKIKGWEVIRPAFHIFYESRVVDMKDGLQKWEKTPGPGGVEATE